MKTCLLLYLLPLALVFSGGRLEAQTPDNVYNYGTTISVAAGETIVFSGDLNNFDNGSLHPDFINNGLMRLKGDYVKTNATTYSGTGVFELFSNGAQNFDGQNFYRLRVKNGGSKFLTSNARIADSLTITHGNINTDVSGSKFTVDSAAFVSESDTSYVTGRMEFTKYFQKGVVYTNVAGLGLDMSSSNMPMGLTSVARGTGNQAIQLGNSVSPGGLQYQSIARYFDITPANNGNLGATLTFHYHSADKNGQSESSFSFYRSHDNGVHWKFMGGTPGLPGTQKISLTGIDSFSLWTVADNLHNLPVEFLGFNARLAGSNTELDWTTASEINCERFEVERSLDGVIWQKIGENDGHGVSHNLLKYFYTDKGVNLLSANVLYYRLRQVDYNGRADYSEIRKVRLDGFRDLTYKIYPIPAKAKLTVETAFSGLRYVIYSENGKRVQEGAFSGTTDLNLQGIRPGIYQLELLTPGGMLYKERLVIVNN